MRVIVNSDETIKANILLEDEIISQSQMKEKNNSQTMVQADAVVPNLN